MNVNFFCEEVKQPVLHKTKLRAVIRRISTDYNINLSNINFIFCSDAYLLDINRQYLAHDYYTDIITFHYNDGGRVNSDIFISIERVEENAVINNVLFEVELVRVVIHGILHLCGLEDDTCDSKMLMSEKENRYLSLF